ncbi:hypothetical protein [Cellulosimicrobium sp. Marseille-Q4280]|uniref:hypothetical protein n=1 Tax=Cellulosimicrobium sp. Marseille-Q4280 TaxID=2937992 RepID=UPI00203F3494|nr:hypothetical protein [Cellulosimicrobium sp. Marseille-Q4280]
MENASRRAFLVARAHSFFNGTLEQMKWSVLPLAIPDGGAFDSTIAPSREGALALAAPMFAAYPDVPVIGRSPALGRPVGCRAIRSGVGAFWD